MPDISKEDFVNTYGEAVWENLRDADFASRKYIGMGLDAPFEDYRAPGGVKGFISVYMTDEFAFVKPKDCCGKIVNRAAVPTDCSDVGNSMLSLDPAYSGNSEGEDEAKISPATETATVAVPSGAEASSVFKGYDPIALLALPVGVRRDCEAFCFETRASLRELSLSQLRAMTELQREAAIRSALRIVLQTLMTDKSKSFITEFKLGPAEKTSSLLSTGDEKDFQWDKDHSNGGKSNDGMTHCDLVETWERLGEGEEGKLSTSVSHVGQQLKADWGEEGYTALIGRKRKNVKKLLSDFLGGECIIFESWHLKKRKKSEAGCPCVTITPKGRKFWSKALADELTQSTQKIIVHPENIRTDLFVGDSTLSDEEEATTACLTRNLEQEAGPVVGIVATPSDTSKNRSRTVAGSPVTSDPSPKKHLLVRSSSVFDPVTGMPSLDAIAALNRTCSCSAEREFSTAAEKAGRQAGADSAEVTEQAGKEADSERHSTGVTSERERAAEVRRVAREIKYERLLEKLTHKYGEVEAKSLLDKYKAERKKAILEKKEKRESGENLKRCEKADTPEEFKMNQHVKKWSEQQPALAQTRQETWETQDREENPQNSGVGRSSGAGVEGVEWYLAGVEMANIPEANIQEMERNHTA